MGAALSIFVILSLSVFVIRVASVALRITGLPDASARFQALSAFTGTGFTTSEAEAVVNYPIRRRVVSILMIIGNMGIVTVFATLVVSLVHTDGDIRAVIVQLSWLLAGLALLWFLMLNKTADRVLCTLIGGLLESTTFLGRRNYHRLLQLGDGYSICEHEVSPDWTSDLVGAARAKLSDQGLVLMGARSSGSRRLEPLANSDVLSVDQTVVIFGPDSAHEALGAAGDSNSGKRP